MKDFGNDSEKLLPQIVKALREISEWPWKWQIKLGSLHSPFKEKPLQYGPSVLYLADPDMIRAKDIDLEFIARSPLWLASLVVALVRGRAVHECDILHHTHVWCDLTENHALREFGLTESDWEWLKGMVDRGQ